MAAQETKRSTEKKSSTDAKLRERTSPMEIDPEQDPLSGSENGEASGSSSDEEAVEEPEEDPVVVANRAKEEGNAQFKQQKYGAAIDLYTQAFSLNPTEPSYLMNRAACYMALKHYKSALEDCQSAAQMQQASPQPKTLLRLARCQFALGRPTPALATVQSLLGIEPSNTQAISLRQNINQLQIHIDRFHQSREAGEWVVARLALENAEKMIDGSIPIEWRCWKIEIEIRRKRWDAATSAASDALRIDSNSPEVLTARALVLFLTNRIPSSIQHVQSALRYDPEYNPARLLLRRAREIERIKEEGNSAFKAGRHEVAISKYTETLEAIGERPEEGGGGQLRALVLANRAAALLKAEKYQQALDDSDESLKIHPGYYKTIRTRARVRLALEEYDEAIQDFKSALEASIIEASAAEQKSIEKEIRMAEVQLKRSKTKDYYKILKLPKTCSEVDIKKAYRRESLIHHPDKGGDEEKFKLVVEAHAVLSDPVRRQRYDSGADEDGQMDSGGPGGMGGGMGGGVDLSDLFGMGGGFGGGFPGGGFPGGGGGGRGGHFQGGGFGF